MPFQITNWLNTKSGCRPDDRAYSGRATQARQPGIRRQGRQCGVADADIDAALDGVLFGYILNQGEKCVQGRRLIIEDQIAGEFVERLAARSARVKVGMPLDESADMDSLIHEQHMDKVLGYIESGSREVGFWREAQCRGRL